MKAAHITSILATTATYLCLFSPLLSLGAAAQTPEKAQETTTPEIEETVHIIGKRQGNYTIITEDTLKLVDMPGALGDPLGAISALPGVITPAGGGAPAVRGSSPADNRYFVDGMPAGYIFHEFNTSIFDENIVQDFQLYPAGFGAEFSNATGAVFDIRLRDPAQQPLTTTISASMLRAGVLLESEVTENSAFYLSMRKSLIQFFIPEDDPPVDNPNTPNNEATEDDDNDGIYFSNPPEDSDYVFKYLWAPDNHRLSFNMVGANDKTEAELTEVSEYVFENPDFAGDAEIDNLFNSQSIQWETSLSEALKVQAIFAHYKYEYNLLWGQGYVNNTTLDDLSFRGALEYALSNHTIITGAELSQSEFEYRVRFPLFVCTELDVSCNSNRREEPIDASSSTNFNRSTLYAIDRWQATPNLSIEAGLQWTETEYNQNQFTHPRVAINWQALSNIALKMSAGSYDLFPEAEHILKETGNPNLENQTANHYVMGVEGALLEHWTWSVEVYHKQLADLPLALGPSQPDTDLRYANDVEGTAKGVDIFLNKNLSNKWYGWVSLSLSDSERKNTRTGDTVDYVFDVPWVFNAVGNYQWTDKWNIGFRLTAKAGEPYSPIIGLTPNPNFPDRDPPSYLPVYDAPYSDRLPTYARLDVRIARDVNWFGNAGSVFVDIINATNRENVTEIQLDYPHVLKTGTLKTEKQADLGIFPSLGVSFTF